MGAPAYTSPQMWAFWLAFKKMEPKARLGGTFANKRGYHNVPKNLSAGDYSLRYGRGNAAWCAAIDLTMPLAEMKKYSARLLRSGLDAKDPRLNYLREFFGNVDGNQIVDGFDFQSNTRVSSDKSHLWHIHISFMRAYVADPACYRALLSVLRGESVVVWRVKEWALSLPSRFAGAKPAVKPAPAPVKPAGPAPLRRVLKAQTPPLAGSDVQTVQRRVKAAVDGVYGPATAKLVAAFQAANGLKATGVVDAATWAKIVAAPAAPSKPPAAPLNPAPRFHTVRPGQTLTAIAQAYKITFATLQKLNPQKRGNWDNIAIGERIRIK